VEDLVVNMVWERRDASRDGSADSTGGSLRGGSRRGANPRCRRNKEAESDFTKRQKGSTARPPTSPSLRLEGEVGGLAKEE
jgi:hypothetical protein